MTWTPVRLIILFCYTFVLGVAIGMFFYTIPPDDLPAATSALYSLLVIAAAAAYFKKNTGWAALAIVLPAIALGIIKYSRAVDTTDPNHLSHFVKAGTLEPVTVTGVIDGDPDVRERYINCTLKPEKIVISGEEYESGGGNILLRMYPKTLKSYGEYEHGDRVKVTAVLESPRGRNNPGGFDYRTWLINHGIYATMQIREDYDIEKIEKTSTHPITRFALDMKYKFIRTTKLTMPYPESSFLGGVTLGLKGGVTPQIRYEFQATGVAHVLAVSGLHVGFVAALLVMLAHLLKIAEKFRPPFLMVGLLIFTIITGASPATIRASIMFSLFMCIRTYMRDMDIIGSTLLTIPIAGFAILGWANPLLLVDASFLLSFGAVLSLGLLTVPVQNLFNRHLYGFRLLAAILIIGSLTAVAVFNWDLVLDPVGGPAVLTALAGLFIAAIFLERKFPMAVGWRFDSLHPWLGAFLAAQIAINLGNSPLFALYFNHLSLSGYYANLICIPLCGVVVQLGLIADLLAMIPYAGMPLAVLVNGGNYLMCKLFLGTAHFFAEAFPYPFCPTPSAGFSAGYYGALFAFIYREWIAAKFRTVHAWYLYRHQFPDIRRKFNAAAAGLVVLIAGPAVYFTAFADKSARPLQVTFFEVGNGSSTLIQTPGGKNILVDAGSYETFRDFDPGRMVIGPAFSEYGVYEVDDLVLTTFAPEHIGGMQFIAGQFPVRRFIDPLPVSVCDGQTDIQEFKTNWTDAGLGYITRNKKTTATVDQYRGLVKRLEEVRAPRIHQDGEMTLVDENSPGGRLVISVLPVSGESRPDVLIVKIVYGRTSALLTGDLDEEAMDDLVSDSSARSFLDADVLLAPSHGMLYDEPFIDAVSPSKMVIQFRPGFHRRGAPPETPAVPEGLPDIRVYRTDQNGAVLALSDGRGWTVKPFIAASAEDNDAGRAHEF